MRPRHVFSLFDVILPTENEWQNVTDWLPPLPVHFLLASFVWSFFGLFVGNKCDLLSNGIGETARESRIFGQKAFCSARGHSRVSGKRQSVSRRVFFPFFVSPLCRIIWTDADRV